ERGLGLPRRVLPRGDRRLRNRSERDPSDLRRGVPAGRADRQHLPTPGLLSEPVEGGPGEDRADGHDARESRESSGAPPVDRDPPGKIATETRRHGEDVPSEGRIPAMNLPLTLLDYGVG